MREVSEQEASKLISDGEAGWYAINAVPIPHSNTMIVQVGKNNYLCSTDDISVIPLKPIKVGKVLKLPYAVNINSKSPIASILKKQLEKK